jgi:hypothetical protein
MRLPIVMQYSCTLSGAASVEQLLSACAEFEDWVATRKANQNVAMWSYGVDVNQPTVVRCTLVLWDIASHGPVTKTQAYRRWRKVLNGLVPTDGLTVTVAEDVRAAVSLHHQLRRAA